MKKLHFYIKITWLFVILAIINISCEKPDSEQELPASPAEEQTTTVTERLVGIWARDYNSLPTYDTLVFSNEGKCFYINGESEPNYSSDTIEFFYEFSGQFLILYNSLSEFNPLPRYIKFYDDYSYFVMYNYPFEMIDVVMNVGFRKID